MSLIVPTVIAGAFFMDGLDSPSSQRCRKWRRASGFAAPDERGDHVLSHQPRDLHSDQRLIADRFGRVSCSASSLLHLGSVLCGLSQTCRPS
jgi:hypothetical protein